MKQLIISISFLCMFMGIADAQGTFVPPSSEGWKHTESTQRQSEYPKVNDKRGRLALADDWSGNFEEMLLNEAIPDIEKFYRVIPDAEHRAMAGLSLGGMLTNAVGLKNSKM